MYEKSIPSMAEYHCLIGEMVCLSNKNDKKNRKTLCEKMLRKGITLEQFRPFFRKHIQENPERYKNIANEKGIEKILRGIKFSLKIIQKQQGTYKNGNKKETPRIIKVNFSKKRRSSRSFGRQAQIA